MPAPAGPRAPTSTGKPLARMDLDTVVCGECATLEPGRPGSLLRAAARVLGAAEDDPYLEEALREDGAALDGLLYADRDDPLRLRARSPQREPWQHVPRETRGALRRAQARAVELRVLADRDRQVGETAPPSGPAGCLLCGVGASARWRRVLTRALTPGPDHVEGHVCAACSEAYDRVGAIGPSLVERAARAHAGVPAEVPLPGLRAWVATGLPPGEPWAWVDLRPPEPGPDPVEAMGVLVAELRAEVAAPREAAGR